MEAVKRSDVLDEIKARLAVKYNDSLGNDVELSDISYLISRLEAAEKVARDGYRVGRKDALSYTIEELTMFLEEMKRKLECHKTPVLVEEE